MKGFYSREELDSMGFIFGENVLISKLSQIYCDDLVIGDNVRIDDFCVLTGKIKIGNYVHIANYCGLYGNGEIQMDNFSNLSSKCTIYSASDDFSGEFLAGPMCRHTNVKHSKVHLMKHTLVGTGSTILPGVTMHIGSCLGAMSLALKDIHSFELHVGQPAKFLKTRSTGCLDIEKRVFGG